MTPMLLLKAKLRKRKERGRRKSFYRFQKKKRRRRRKAASDLPSSVLPAGIPVLNGTSAELIALGKDLQDTSCLSEQKKRRRNRDGSSGRPRKKPANGIPKKIIDNSVRSNGEALETTLLLTFASGVSMPSKEVLIATFCGFGPLKKSETKLSEDSSKAQVVFARRANAEKAVQSFDNSNPFGATLLGFQLHPLSTDFLSLEGSGNAGKPSGSMPHPKEPLPIDSIRQNLEMMTSIVEKPGNDISTEMRTKLENEIKGLLVLQLLSWDCVIMQSYSSVCHSLSVCYCKKGTLFPCGELD
ncbi:serine/threonine-protein kinase ATM-like [Tripterygium wilfordii]|uniref:Serine/threonine-protein kinase ATM-like n=1 Tax=Tripterygium wilfordii TaxID=458696 RepID=A0A7J7C9P1_TRIWF|nr:serine/threonine-protein kinase ATM-like [Tripterygium wilfordii]